MTTYKSFRSSSLDKLGFLDKFVCQENLISITEDLNTYVNDEFIGSFQNLEEARAYARNYISSKKILETVDSYIPEEKIVALIKKYHNVDKITSNLVESYKNLASSNLFTLDPVINEMKQVQISGKRVYDLEDGSTIAISEDTFYFLSDVLDDKYQIVEYMRKSKDNFMHVIKKLREE